MTLARLRFFPNSLYSAWDRISPNPRLNPFSLSKICDKKFSIFLFFFFVAYIDLFIFLCRRLKYIGKMYFYYILLCSRRLLDGEEVGWWYGDDDYDTVLMRKSVSERAKKKEGINNMWVDSRTILVIIFQFNCK